MLFERTVVLRPQCFVRRETHVSPGVVVTTHEPALLRPRRHHVQAGSIHTANEDNKALPKHGDTDATLDTPRQTITHFTAAT